MILSKLTLEHPSGGIPSRAKGVEKVAVSEAMIPSQRVAEVTLAPIAGPLAAISIGLEKSKKVSNTIYVINIY
jgi:hypothetical protein